MDTMTLTKAFASICGAFLILLLGKWAAEGLYHVESHGDQAYVIEVEEGGEEAPAEEEAPFLEVFAAADPADGERIWRQCQACHNLEGANGVGPYLNGVVGRQIASVDGYSYSAALSGIGDVWSPENLSGFIANPSGWAPGTAMGYSGLKDVEDRAALIAFLDPSGEAQAAAASAAPAEDPAEASAEEAPAEEAAEAPAEEAAEAPAEETAVEEAAEAPAEEAAPAEETAEAPAEETAPAEEAAEAPANDAAAAEPMEMAQADTAADEAPAEEAAADAGASILASADAAAGEGVWRQCQACHNLEGRNGVGPYLNGVVGRDIASIEGFRYSDALMGLEGNWTPEELSAFIENPREYATGTKMGYRGLSDEEDRLNLIAYLASIE